MDNITNEIVRSQQGGALLAGCRVTPEYLTELKENINIVRDVARLYCALNVTNMKSRGMIGRYFLMEIRCVNKLLPVYIDKLRQGLRIEAFCISSGIHRDDMFWEWCDTLCCDMKGQTVYRQLRDGIDKLQELLIEAESVLMHCEPAQFEKFFFSEKEHYSNTGVVRRFETWLYDNSYPDIDKLRELQALVVAETLKKGVMDYAKVPSQKEIDQVDVDILKSLLPYDFEMTADFRVACARWRRFMHWEGYILIINYKKYGKYIHAHFYEFSKTQLQAIFELDMKLQLIHQEMQKLMDEQRHKDTDSVLKSEKAMKYWKRLMKLGLVDGNCQLLPATSRQQAMYIVEPFAEKLGLKKQWKPFEDFWGIKNLAQEKWKFQQTAVLPPMHEDIDHVFED